MLGNVLLNFSKMFFICFLKLIKLTYKNRCFLLFPWSVLYRLLIMMRNLGDSSGVVNVFSPFFPSLSKWFLPLWVIFIKAHIWIQTQANFCLQLHCCFTFLCCFWQWRVLSVPLNMLKFLNDFIKTGLISYCYV